MISAFGVEHGDISKAYGKIQGRLARTRNFPRATDTFKERMKVNYTQGRENAGFLQREVNPNKWAKADAENAEKYGIKVSPRVAESRLRTAESARDKAKQRKLFANKSVEAYSRNARRTRTLP